MIIGVTGTIGAGKGTVVEYLIEKRGFKHYSVRDYLMFKIQERGLPPDRNSTRLVANEIRKEKGPAYIVEQLFDQAVADGKDALIESIRTVGEAEFLKSKGALILAVDADRKIRYDRITARGLSTDHVDFDTWVAQEERELASTDPWDMNVIKVMQMSDARIENDNSLEELHARVDAVLGELGNA